MSVGLKPIAELLPIQGIRIATLSAGIYARQRDDLALLEIQPDAGCAAVFTRNAFAAAPVILARKHLREAGTRYCLINAGNANAGTGEQGISAAVSTCAAVAAVGDCDTEAVLPFSTGVIGEHLPVDRICEKIPALHRQLAADNWPRLARAIMTTDTVPKGISRQARIGETLITVTGVAKGAGMIRPDMATMLAFIATDAAVEGGQLKKMLYRAVEGSFNRICIDGDMSTNDACVLIATGAGGMPLIDRDDMPETGQLQELINEVCRLLAQAVVRDGEGATKFITVCVEQGRDKDECLAAAYAIATSPLIKTAFFASDPNWGRLLAAVGRAGIPDLEIGKVMIYLDELCIVSRGGRDPAYTEAAGKAVMSGEEIGIRVQLGRGQAEETVWTCDLSHEYVRINAEYRT